MSHELEHDEDKAKGVGDLLKEAATAIKLRRYEDAEDYCVQALGVLDKASATEHPSKAMALEFMGDALTGMERYDDASGFYRRAMSLSERLFTQENQVYISIVYKLARTYESLSLLDECVPFFKSADELAKRNLSPDHPLREAIEEGYAHLISRTKKRREKVSEIMDSFRTEKGRSVLEHDTEGSDEEEEGVTAEQPEAISHHEKHTASTYKDLRQKATLYDTSAETMQTWLITIVLLAVGAGAVYVGYKQVSKHITQAPPPVAAEEKSAPTEFAKTYSSLDGKRKLKIADANQGVVEFGTTDMKAKIFQGADAWKAAEDTSMKDPLKLTYVESHGSIMDDAGNFLYAEDSPEMKTRSAMQSVAKALRNGFLLRGSFPQNADELNQAQITYKNPVSGKIEAPIIQTYRGDQGWNPNNPEEKSTFETSFESGNLWTNEPPFLPGSVHIFQMAGAPADDPGSASNHPAVAIIKGADRNSSPIKVDKEKAYLIVLTPKAERTTVGSSPVPLIPDGSEGAIVTIKSAK